MATQPMTIDRKKSAERIERDIETLAGPDYTRSSESIMRYAYTPEYRKTLDYFIGELEALGFEHYEDPVGTLVARNRPAGEKVFGVGSHCDSNRNGGKYDGTMGVVTALEVSRLNEELGLNLPLQLISFLEEEGSGFGQMLLGSRIIAQRVTEEELKESFRAIDDGRSFWEHAGATPMDLRLDPTLPLAETITELERLAREAGKGTVGTVGEIEVEPGIINAIASSVRFSLDVRGPDDDTYRGVAREIAAFAGQAAERRGMRAEYTQRQALAATPMDTRIVDALEAAAAATGEPYVQMHSGAAHDTMCVADRVPTAMVFVPCKDGISHHPAEDAEPEDAAVAAEIILNAIADL